MAIGPAFLIKHLRPVGLSAASAFFSNEFQTYLTTNLGLSKVEVSQLASSWTATAMKDPQRDQRPFVDAAAAVSMARWSELYSTPKSTIAFVTSDQLATLSEAADNADTDKPGGRSFVVDFSGDPVAIAVTLHRDRTGPDVALRVTGLNISTDGSGNIVHLAGIES